VFDESSIPGVVRILERRQASLWHACQLIDLAAYLQLRGIASRDVLDRNDLTSTPMASAGSDRRDGHGDRVVCSLDDIGHEFAAGWSTTPNLSGPIVLQLAPAALLDATQVDVSLGTTASLTDPDTVDSLFQYDATADFPRSTRIAFGERLRDAFGTCETSSVDVRLVPRRAQLGLRHVVAVWVDPVTIGDAQLIDAVAGLAESSGVALRIRRRTLLTPARGEIWGDIVRLVGDGERPLIQLQNRVDASAAFRDWARELHASRPEWPWDRFVRHLREGTLRYLAPPRPAPSVGEFGARADIGAHVGFWSATRRANAKGTRTAAPRAASTAAPPLDPPRVRACGHPARTWDKGVCWTCIGRSRARWRYEG
jgi:hypothetical protein